MIREKLLKDTLATAKHSDVTTWMPIFYRLEFVSEQDELTHLINSKSPAVTDDIQSQLAELIKARHPKKKLTPSEIESAILTHLGGTDITSYGLWTYFPWSNRLVHLLPEKEFIEVRTNRNHYKISPAEEKVLAKKKVGLIGLSVGQSVAVTMAMERSFGELRLADFDSLELTNLNRIRTGVHNLGVSKVISVAREILEIDPFLNIKCFTDGLTENNIEEFFHQGGDLDLLIDECDGLDMKIISRWKAREMKIPVVMEASDRGMVDVERFDLEPDRPLLHGMVEDLSPEKLKTLETNEDKIPYMLAIVGADTISTRAKASMLEIGETISTWPQLASAVTLGGGITADVVRRIFLDKYHESGRYYMDVEEIIGDRHAGTKEESKIKLPKPDEDFGPELKHEGKISLDDQVVERIVKTACHAPSGGNLQPWKWTNKNEVFQLKFDRNLTSSFLDHHEIASMIALGASLENACLEGINQGYENSVSFFPNQDEKDIVAHLCLTESKTSSELDKWLGENVLNRETNRNLEQSIPLSQSDIKKLKTASQKNGSNLIIVEPGEEFDRLAALIARTERFRIMHPTGHRNFTEEMRWTKEEVESTKDGIDIATVDLTIGELTGFKLARNREVIDKLVEWKGGSAFEKLSRKSTSAAAALGIITRPKRSRLDYLQAGMDMERAWIAANALNMGFQPQSPLSLLLPRLEDGSDLSSDQFHEFTTIAKELQEIMPVYTEEEPIFIFRLFYKQKDVVKSLRRELSLHFKKNK
ncbi:Rv1355c family protein [Cryomorphaceae bacterium 1068]|nr:Rv1355c family protein [Cryomorphaceae bacterium 1068]